MIWAGVLAAAWSAAAPGGAADPAPPVPDPRIVVPPLPGPPPGPPQDPPVGPLIPQQPFQPEAILPDGSRVTLPASARQIIRISPRYGTRNEASRQFVGDDTQRIVYTGGIIFNIVYLGNDDRPNEVELATDNAVAWIRGTKGRNVGDQLNTGVETGGRTEVEFYLQGNVVIRTVSTEPTGARTMYEVFRAKEVYYEVNRSRAIALSADLELNITGLPEAVHLRG
ncbi:MAG: hypothetical protein LC708_04280, partial [Actinobacteria bacterium]|nr:hypothetical protein [Actinomycetota bacterium]